MKPIKIEFQAFGPYADYEVVDFTKIASNGLFLICGKTGTGKTTILDAITFALYGRSSGHGRDSFEAMRCTKADYDRTTFVKFEFENNGVYYIFERRLERKRKNLSKEYNVMRKNEAGIWEVLLENPKERELNAMAEEIIGLQYDQFRQVIVLPQGQFEKLLTSNSDEKEAILTSIFGEEMWQRIADKFYEKARERKEGLDSIKDYIKVNLEGENCESIAQLESAVYKMQQQLNDLEEEYNKADYEGVIKKQDELLGTAKRFGDLHTEEAKLRALEDKKAQYNEWVKQEADAARAEKVKALMDAADTAEEELKSRIQAEKKARAAAKEAKAAAEQAVEKYNKHIESEKDIERKKELKIQYEGKKEDYKGLDGAERELKKLRAGLEEAGKKVSDANEKCTNLGKKILRLQSEYKELDREYNDLQDRYLAGITGEIAKTLEEGIPCPVCGSTSHPNKAVMADDSVTKAEVDSKKALAAKKDKERDDAVKAKNDAEELRKEKNNAFSDIKGKVAAAEAKLEKRKENLVKGIESLAALENAIETLSSEIERYNNTKEQLEGEKRKAENEFTEKKSGIESAEKERGKAEDKYSKAEETVKEALEKNRFTSEDEAKRALLSEEAGKRIKGEIEDYRGNKRAAEGNISNLKNELKDTAEPDKEQCEEIKEQANSAKEEYLKKTGGMKRELKRLQDKAGDLKQKGEGLEEKLHEAENDLAFAKSLRGDTGTGLQRYVLGIMFSSVVAAANKMLEMVHGGRYRLYRSDERAQGSNKRGLELKVFDKNSEDHEGRFVNTLSGGEKFLASLALSIGMSAVAQKGGIKIEALFIDEGFGSLDEDSIGDAMNILNSIQEANGLVGIISHVQLLQERIPAKLKVEESKTGSHIVQTIG